MLIGMLPIPVPRSRRCQSASWGLTQQKCGPLNPALSGSKSDIIVDSFKVCSTVVGANTTSVAWKAQDNSHIGSDMFQHYSETQLFVSTNAHLLFIIPRSANVLPIALCMLILMGCVFHLLRCSFWAYWGWHIHSCNGNTRSGRIYFILHKV